MDARGDINEYDVGLPVPLAPLDERRRAIPPAVWSLLLEAKERARAIVGTKLRDVRLFGSYARTQFDEDSDVDVLVIAESLEPAERMRVLDAMHGLSRGDLILSPLVLTSEQLADLRRREMILAQDIDREGIAI